MGGRVNRFYTYMKRHIYIEREREKENDVKFNTCCSSLTSVWAILAGRDKSEISSGGRRSPALPTIGGNFFEFTSMAKSIMSFKNKQKWNTVKK
jgi:hypothetical protein